jgi:hypothetical protein
MPVTLNDRIQQAREKLKKLEAARQQADARRRAAASKKMKAIDTRKKILVGSLFLARVERGEVSKIALDEMLNVGLTREDDRLLFDLPPLQISKTGTTGILNSGQREQA